MQDGCKVYMDSYMASNGLCLMVTWTIFKNHLLEVSLTQNRETMALRTLTALELFWFIIREDLREWKFIEIALVEGPVTYECTLHLRTRDHNYMTLEVSWDGLWTRFLVTALGLCVKWP